MAIKNKFIHFKTRAAFNANVPNPALTADEGNTFYNYTTFIQDTKEIYTHGTFYKSNTTWDMLKITKDISYAALFKNNAKVGDIVQLEGATDFIIFSASIDNSSFMSLLQGSTSDINTYIVYYDDSTQLYIFDEDSSLSIANNNNINSIVRSYVGDTYITEKTLEKLPAGTNASITATDSILNAFAKLQGQVNAKANTSSIPTAATVTPKASGTAAVGTSTKYAREDHVHPLQTNVETATKLATPRVIAIAGAVSGSATFDGSSNVSINSTLNGFDASKITSGTISEARLPNIPIEKLPAGALERMFVVESQTAAIDAVKAGTIQEGDVVQIGNGGLMYFCIDDAATTFGNAFKEFTAGSATSVPWSGVTGKPSSFTPSAHNQASNTITALTGYAKSTNAAITTSDTLNTALGKLETKVDITYGWGNHASAGYAKATQLANYLPLTGGTLTGGLTANNISLFDSGKTNDYNVTAKIGDPSTYSTPVRFAPSSAHGHYAIQFSDADSVLFGKIRGKFVKIISDVNKAEVVADSFYMGGNLVATQSWVTGKGYLTSVPAQTWASITGKPSTFTPSAHTQSYTTLTGSTTTANQAIVSNGTANGWTLKTLGSLAFSSATIPTKTSQLTNDSGFLTSVPAQSWASITGKPTFATVATSGSYNDLSNKPTIPSLSGYATQSWVTSQGYLTSIPVATSSAYGGIQIGYTTSGKNYAVQLSNGKAYVNVPWTDTNTTYTSGTNISISGTTINCTYSYSLPTATSSVLGGVKVGSNITLSSGTISLSKSNVTSALGFTPANVNEIPIALPNPYALTINGTLYTGSSAVSINTARILSTSTLSSSTVSAGYSYNNTLSRTISSLSGFSSSNPDSVIISTARLTFTASNAIKMDGLANLSGTYYIYCLSYMANGKVAVNGAAYA